MTSAESMFIRNPNRDITEDRKVKENYTVKDISLVLARSRLVLFYFSWFLELDTWIFQFHYPKFSMFAYFLIIFIIIVFDSQLLLSYVTLLALLLIGSYSKFCDQKITPKLRDYFFNDEERNPSMRSLNQIMK